MKHKTWFRLVLKAIGIYFLAQSLPGLVNQVYWVTSNLLTDRLAANMGPSPYPILEYWIPSVMHFAMQLGIGLYLLFGGRWLVNLCIPSNRPYCPECGYDVSRVSAAQCPECGTALPRPTAPPAD